MKPLDPLMHEHRLIEDMIDIVQKEKEHIVSINKINTILIDTAVDFIRIYADMTHHGKEEDILFRYLAAKEMAPEEVRVMQELMQEHTFARKVVRKLVAAKEDHLNGTHGSIGVIVDCLTQLIGFYPGHIQKEEKEFFYPILKYFSQREQIALLKEFYEFDRNMIHVKYKSLVENLHRPSG